MSWNLPTNIMGLYGMQGADDQQGDQQQGQDVFAKGREALYGGSQMGNMMGPMSGGGMMDFLTGGGYAKGGAVDAAHEAVRAHLRNGGGFHPVFNSDREAGIRTIIAEAAKEGYPGMSGVAHNLFNRANAGFRGHDIRSVVTAPSQYSSWNPHGSANQAGHMALKVPESDPTYKMAAEAYDNAAGGIEPDPTHGSSHYRNAAHSSAASNKWANQLQDVNQIGHHTFGREPGFHVPEPKPGMNMGDQQMLSGIEQAKQVSAQMANRPDPFGVGKSMSMPQSMNIAPPLSAPPLPMHQNMGPPMPMQAPNASPPMPMQNAGAPLPPMRPEMGPSMGGMSHPNMGPMQQEMAHHFMGPQMTDMAKPFQPPQMEHIKAPGEELNVLNEAPQAANVDVAQAPANMTDGLEHVWGSAGDLGGMGGLEDIFSLFNRGGAVRPFARGGRATFAEGGEAQPGDDAHRFVDEQLYGDRAREVYRESPMLQQNGDKGLSAAIEYNTLHPSSNAHDFVQQAMNKQEAQLPQYDREMHDMLKEQSKNALHFMAYRSPIAPALAAYDAYEGAKGIAENPDDPWSWGQGAMAMTGAGGGKMARAMLGAGAGAGAMSPDDAQASGYGGRGSFEAALQAAKRLVEQGQKAYSGDRLLVTHSADSAKLAERLKDYDGSIIGPSLAVSKIGGVPVDFGNVTFVGRPHLAMPDEDVRMWRADAYTPRFPALHPNPGYLPPEKMPLVEEYAKRFADEPNKYAMANAIMREVEDRATRTGLINYFDKPERGGVKNLVYNTRDRLIGEGELVPATPENIIQNMLSGRIEGGEGNGGHVSMGLLKALAHPQVKSAEELQKERHLIAEDDEVRAADWGDLYNRASAMGALHAKNHRNPSNYPENDFVNALIDYTRAGEVWGDGEKALFEHYPRAPRDLVLTAQNFMSDLKGVQPSYYEAKAFRPVGMDEFAGAIVPSNRNVDDVVNTLADYGMDRSRIKLYREQDDEQRLQRIYDEFKDNFFADGGGVDGPQVSESSNIAKDERDAMTRAIEMANTPADRAQSYTPSSVQERITPDMYNNFMSRSTAQFIKGNNGQAVSNSGDGQDMDIVRAYRNPLNYNQEIDKLRKIGTGSVTDPEGRTGHPVFVAGTAPDGSEIAMNEAQAAMMAHAIARLTYNYDDDRANVRGATVAAGGPMFEDGLPKGQTGQVITVNQAPFESGGNPTSTIGHESGHAAARIMDIPVNHELEGANAKVMADMRRMNAERTGMTEEQLYEKHPFAKRTVHGSNGASDAQEYYTMPSESWADAFGRYLTTPNDFKVKYPDAAKYLRDKVNTNPELNRLLFLSQDDGRQYSAEGGRIEKGGGGSMKQAAEIIKRLGKLMPEGSGFAGIPHQPSTVNLPGIGRVEARPIEDLQAAKNRILDAQGRPAGDPQLVPINPKFSARVADAFEKMKNDPQDPLVKRSYDAMISDTMDQYRAAKGAGYDFHFLRNGEADPYAASPALGYADLVNNRRLAVFPTDQGFGTLNEASQAHPLLTNVGRVGDLDDATANDAFRLVHDVYGHHGPGNAFFRAPGEERAFQYHSNMYSDAALPAATAETRGQNSWVNFGPHAEHNATANGGDTIYADQKAGIMPAWAGALPPHEGMTDSDIDDYVRTLMRRASGGRTGAAEDTTAHDFDRQMLDSGEPQVPQHNDRFERGMNEMFGMPEAEAGSAKEAAEYVARRLANYGKQTVNNPTRNAFPAIYSDPRELVEEAASRVAPENIAMKQLFGVTRQDLYDMSAGRVGNAAPELAMKANPRGSDATANVMTPRNASRLMDVLAEAGKEPGIRVGMDAWYTMDPLFQQFERLYGKEEAIKHFNLLNHATGTMSPGSPVTTEMNRGLAAYYLARNGRADEFVQHGGNPGKATTIEPGNSKSFADEFPDLLGHAYHSTSQAPAYKKYVDTGAHGMESPKVPLYIQSSGVPETGHQTNLPVADAHFTRALGLPDTRGGSDKGAGVSMKMGEFQQLGPWFRDKVANKVGLESVPAQARLWGAMSGATGVDTPIGAPKLELMAGEIMRIAHKYGISPERARDMVLQGELFNQGGAVNDNTGNAVERARSLASAT